MNTKLIALELKMLTRGVAFRAALLTLAVLLAFSAQHQRGVVNEEEVRVQEALAEAERKKADSADLLVQVENGEKSFNSLWDDPRGYFTWHRNLTRYPASDLNLLASGQRDLHAPVNAVGIFKPPAVAGKDIDNPVPHLFGAFDPAFVLVFLLPLFIIAFSYGLIAREVENGTLSLLLAQSGSPFGILALKTLPRFAVLTGAALVFTLGALMLAGVNLLANLPAMLWLSTLIAAYSLFWFLAALGANLIFRSSAANAMALASIWVVVTIFLPAAVSTLSDRLFPMPSRIEMVNAVRAAGKDADRRAQKIMARFYHDHPELNREETTPNEAHQRFFDYYRKSLSVGLEAEGAVKPTLDLFTERQQKQQNLEDVLSFLSPSALTAASLEELAGSAPRQYQGYAQALSDFSTEWRSHFRRKAFAGELIETRDLAEFPTFSYNPADVSNAYPLRLAVLLLIDAALCFAVFARVRGRGVYRLLA
ncbi:MAG: ABC transporter permease subunit [Acidobacteriota bacterium]|nr:ABC transporter permease subunit [Acidobacteriota bacterium]